MNRIFNLIWSKTKEKWIVVSEKVKGNGKVPSSPLRSLAALTALFMGGVPAYAIDPGSLPTEGQITAGSGTITTSGTQMTVNQSSQQLIANWGTFNIGENAAVRFNQPNSSSAALNRIFDQNPSQIMGSLSSNGQVFLLNPAGIIFGKTARVDVGGLVASSLNMLDSDFLAGKYTFTGNGSSGALLNQGVINTANGGVVALMAPTVTNEGSITANSGSVLLTAGNKVSLDFTGDGLISYTVDQGAVDALVENKGLIKADGGLVVMTSRAADALHMATTTNSGVIEAHTIQNKAGRILLLSDMANGQTNVGGTLDASAPNSGDGGFIETSAGRVKISDGTIVTTLAPKGKTGMWLIDPDGFTIAATGGDMTGSFLSSSLDVTGVEIKSVNGSSGSDGNINVNDVVSWSKNKLTLTATNDININAVMTVCGTSSLDLEPGSKQVNMGFKPDGTFKGRVDFFQANGTTPRSGIGFLTINAHDYTVITELGTNNSSKTGTDLQGINGVSGYYALGGDINASATGSWTVGGFTPIGSFTGTFDGLGHTISSLTINRPEDSEIGLFGNSNGIIRNVGLINASVTGNSSVGALVGYNDYGSTITNSYATGSMTGNGNFVGGLVGYNYGSITDSYATGSVTGSGDDVGGLVGYNGGFIKNSFYDMGTAIIKVGNGSSEPLLAAVTPYGIYGAQFNDWLSSTGKSAKSLVITDYFTLLDGYYSLDDLGDVKNILGFVNDTNVKKFRLTNDIALPGGFWIPLFNAAELDGAGHKFTGLSVNQPMNNQIGMIGLLGHDSTINNLGVTGLTITGSSSVGGLVGDNHGTISDSYATGSVEGKSNIGGLVGNNSGSITDSYSTGNVTGSGNDVGGLVGYNGGTIKNSFYNMTTSEIKVGDSQGGTLDAAVTPYGIYGDQFNDWLSDSGKSAKTLNISNYFGLPIDGYYQISSANLHNILGFVNDTNLKKFRLTTDIDLSGTGFWIPLFNAAKLDGAGHKFTGLSINQPMNNEIGMIGLLGHDSTINNLGVTGLGGVDVIGNESVGGLVGLNRGTISNSYATGSVTGNGDFVGGLVGDNNGTITHSHATGSVEGTGNAGGLVGDNYGTITNSHAAGNVDGTSNVGGLVGVNSNGTVGNSYATGNVAGSKYGVGGLVGVNIKGTVGNSYATGNVDGTSYVGGLVGVNFNGTIANSYATGNVSGYVVGGLVGYNLGLGVNVTIRNSYATGSVSGYTVGGLVGYNIGSNHDMISNSYATGSVSGTRNAGGLVGYNFGTIANSYATGNVSGYAVGGLVGSNDGDISHSFYEKDANPLLTGVGDGTPDVAGEVWGMSTANMKLLSNFMEATAANGNVNPGWNFTPGTGVWKIDAATNGGYPYLAWQNSEKFYERSVLSEPLPGVPSYPAFPIAPTGPLIPEGQLLEAKIVSQPSPSAPGLILVTVPQSLGAEGSVFSFVLPDELKNSVGGVVESVTLPDGAPLPSWLHYNPETMTFTATDMPQGMTEFKVLVTLGGKSWIVDIAMAR